MTMEPCQLMFYAVGRTSSTNERTKQGLERQAQLQPQVPQRRAANLVTQTAQAHTHHLLNLSANHHLLLTVGHRLAQRACQSFQRRFTSREARGLIPPGVRPFSKQHEGRSYRAPRQLKEPATSNPTSQRRLTSSVSHLMPHLHPVVPSAHWTCKT